MNLGARLGKVVSVGLRMSTYSIEQRGSPYSMDYRIYFSELSIILVVFLQVIVIKLSVTSQLIE